jgi:multidrug efflux pump
MGGMIAATVLGVFFIPLLYIAVRRWLARDRRRPNDPNASHA